MPYPISQKPGQIVDKGSTQQVAAYDPNVNQNLLEGVPDSNVYMHSAHFKDILTRAKTGGKDSLSTGEWSQLQEAIKLYPQLAQNVGVQQDSQSQVASDQFWKDMKAFGGYIANLGISAHTLSGGQVDMGRNPTAAGHLANIGNDILNWASSFGQDVSPLSMASRAMTGTNKTASESVKETLDNLGLAPLKPGDGYKIQNPADPYGPQINVPYTDFERVVQNTLIGATRLIPDMLTQFADNPVGFITGIVKMPVQVASILNDVLTGQHLDIQDGGIVDRKLSDKEVSDAYEQLVQNPLQIPMAAMVVYGGIKGAANWETRGRGYVDDLRAKAAELEKMKAETGAAQAEPLKASPTEGAQGAAPSKLAADAAKQYGLEAPGVQVDQEGNPAFFTFRDPQNNGNLSVTSLDQLPAALEAHRAKWAAKPSIYDQINLDAVPEDLKVNVETIRAEDGQRVTVEKPAREAYQEAVDSGDLYKRLLECLKS